MEYNYDTIDLTKIYTYKQLPDKESGRCDNCIGSHFNSKVGDCKFLRECSNCGMKS